jgi:hypothetical protein
MKYSIKFGICLDNFSVDFVRRKATFEDLVKMAAKMGYQGIEFTPAQMLPSYPEVLGRDIEQVKELLSKYNMEPFCWNIYLDTGAVTGRDLSENEIHKAVIQNLIYAKKTGFRVIKTSRAITAKIFQKLIPVCRDLDMKLAVEINATIATSEDCDKDSIQEFIRIINSEGEGHAGVILDLKSLSLPTTEIADLLKISFGIYIQPEMLQNNRDIHQNNRDIQQNKQDIFQRNQQFLKTAVEAGFSGYLLCRNGCKSSVRAKAQAEQFLKSCNSMIGHTNIEIEH